MREISCSAVTEAVREMCMEVNVTLSPEVEGALVFLLPKASRAKPAGAYSGS